MVKNTSLVQQMQESAWVNLTIRKATIADAIQIFKIAQSLKLDRKNPQDNGFLVYVTDEEGYKKRIKATPYFYVADRGGEIIGFMFCFDGKTLKQLFEKGIMFGEDVKFPYLLSQKKPWVLVDQLGVMKKYSYQGVGKALFDQFFADLIGQSCAIYAEILHHPVKNHSIINFCTSIGFQKVNVLTNSDTNTWGIYHIPREDEL